MGDMTAPDVMFFHVYGCDNRPISYSDSDSPRRISRRRGFLAPMSGRIIRSLRARNPFLSDARFLVAGVFRRAKTRWGGVDNPIDPHASG